MVDFKAKRLVSWMGTLRHIIALEQLLFYIFPTITLLVKSCPQTELVIWHPVDKRDKFQSTFTTLWLRNLKTRRLFFLWPHYFIQLLFSSSLIIQHISSKPCCASQPKTRGRIKTREDWFSAQIRFHLHREVFGLDGRRGAAVLASRLCFFSKNELGGFSFGNLIHSSEETETWNIGKI